jgi:hypothetical protein
MRPHSRMTSTRMRPGVKHRSTVTQNGHTERGNPPTALGGGRSTQQATSRKPQVGKIAQPIGPLWGKAHLSSRRRGDFKRVHNLQRLLLRSYSARCLAVRRYSTVTVMTKSTAGSAHDKSQSSEEPYEVKISRTVREQRRGG